MCEIVRVSISIYRHLNIYCDTQNNARSHFLHKQLRKPVKRLIKIFSLLQFRTYEKHYFFYKLHPCPYTEVVQPAFLF